MKNTYIDLKNHIVLFLMWFFYAVILFNRYPHEMIMAVFLSLSLFWVLINLDKERLKGKMLYFYIIMWVSLLLFYGVIFYELLFIFIFPLLLSSIYIGIYLYKHPKIYPTNLSYHKDLYMSWMKLLWLVVFILIFKTTLLWSLIPILFIFIYDVTLLINEIKLFEKRMPLFILTIIMFIFAYLSTTVETNGFRTYNILFNISSSIIFLLSMIHLSWMKKTYEKHMNETKEKKLKLKNL